MKTIIAKWLIAAALIVVSTAPGEVAKGTKLEVRLNSKVSSTSSKVGDAVEAIIISPVTQGDRTLIPVGTKITGKVKEVKSTEGKDDQRASLLLNFDNLVSSSDKKTGISARVAAIDNARETVDDKGNIVGILASETLAARMDQGLDKLGQQHGGVADFFKMLKNLVIKEPQPEIDYPVGTEFTLELSQAVKVDIPVTDGDPYQKVKPLSDPSLSTMVDEEPFRTYAQSPSKPSDITNLMFLGTQKEVEAAFAAAGWANAEALNSQSGLETFRAIVENRGYKEAPVSILILDGKPPDLVFQKSTNTFAKRHHLRVWHRPGTYEGKDIWVSSSTHDTDIVFSPENRTFIHKIDSNIDNERAKVVNDLIFTGQVKAYGLIDRTKIPKDASNATGDKLTTDGKMAVLSFE